MTTIQQLPPEESVRPMVFSHAPADGQGQRPTDGERAQPVDFRAPSQQRPRRELV